MPAGPQKKYRALIIGCGGAGEELRGVLNGYGYFVEHCRTRVEGIARFRAHRQSLVILDVEAVSGFPERLFRFFRMVRESSIVLIASGAQHQARASRYLLWGAHDVLHLPIRRDALNFTLSRTSAYHRSLVRSTFYRTAAYFGLAAAPLWAALIFLALR